MLRPSVRCRISLGTHRSDTTNPVGPRTAGSPFCLPILQALGQEFCASEDNLINALMEGRTSWPGLFLTLMSKRKLNGLNNFPMESTCFFQDRPITAGGLPDLVGCTSETHVGILWPVINGLVYFSLCEHLVLRLAKPSKGIAEAVPRIFRSNILGRKNEEHEMENIIVFKFKFIQTFIQYTIYFTTHDLALVGWWTAFWKKIHWRMEVWWRACADSCTFSGQNSGARIAPLATYLGQLQGSLTRYHKISIDIIYYWVIFSVAIMHWCYVKLLLTVNHFVDDFPLHSLFISVNLIVGFDSFLSRSTAETPRTWRRSIQMSFRQGRKFYLLGTIASSSHVIISPSENHHQFFRM